MKLQIVDIIGLNYIPYVVAKNTKILLNKLPLYESS